MTDPEYGPDPEWALVGALLVDPDRLADVPDVTADWFSDDGAAAVFGAIVRLVADGDAVDVITVADALRDDQRLDAVGGLPFLMTLVDATPTSTHVTAYATVVRRAALRRTITRAATRLALAARTAEDPEALLASAQTQWATLADAAATASAPPLVPHAVANRDALDYLQRRWSGTDQPLWTPWPTLDRLAGGIVPEDVVIIAAGTSVGKSTLAVQVAAHAAATGHAVLYVSYEVAPERLALQIATQQTGMDAYRLKRQPTDTAPLARAFARSADWPLFWWRGGQRPPWPTIAAAVPALVRDRHLALLVVDHLELLPLEARQREHLTWELGEIVAQAKALATRHHLAVVLVDQLNREATRQVAPTLANLGWSAGIEKNADKVWALDRADREDPDSDRWVYVLKNREGALGKVSLRWDPGPPRFVDPAAREGTP